VNRIALVLLVVVLLSGCAQINQVKEISAQATLSVLATKSSFMNEDEKIEVLQADVAESLSKSNRDIPRLTGVEFDEMGDPKVSFAINDNLTQGLIILGAKRDIFSILKAVHNSGVSYNSVILAGTFPIKDANGTARETQVFGLVFGKATIDKISKGDYSIEEVYSIAYGGFVVPAFKP
jgi:hypothetical protein